MCLQELKIWIDLARREKSYEFTVREEKRENVVPGLRELAEEGCTSEGKRRSHPVC